MTVFMRTEVIQKIDDLNEIRWEFSFWANKGVILENMYVMSRATKKHKFWTKDDECYSRLNKRQFRADPPEEIPLEVQEEAVHNLRAMVRFEGNGIWTRF